MDPKKHILIFIDWYLPGYKAGGPIQSCANMVNHLKLYYNFSLITRSTDFGETKPYTGIKCNEWILIDQGIRVYYISPDALNSSTIKKVLSEKYDAIYLNSLFSTFFTLLPLLHNKLTEKIVIAPRGMLGVGALGIKPFKKKLFLVLSRVFGLYSKVTWHASTALEANEIKKVFGSKIQIIEALNLPPSRTLAYVKRSKIENNLKLFFLSRISPKKNLLAAFRFLRSVDQKFTISFDIIGPIEDKNYWKECLGEINSLKSSNPNITIRYIGAIKNPDLLKKLSDYQCMILPTLNENFGHVILDSLAAGCPIIVSDQTPWRNLAERGIGWDFPLSESDKFVGAIETIASMNEKTFIELSLNAFNEAVKFYNNKEVVAQNVRIFE